MTLTRDSAHAAAFTPAVGLGAVCLAAALVRWEGAVGWALGLCGAAYVALAAIHGRGVDGTAPLVAVCLVLCGELTAWSLAERGRLRVGEAVQWSRAFAVAGLAAAGLVTAGVVIALGGVQPGGGLVLTAVGVVAAVAAAGGAAILARR